MSHHLAADAAYVADGDNLQEEVDGSCAGRDENDFENNIIEDITAAQAKMGRDIQGIAWERLSVSRNNYRQTRLEQYRNYESVPRSVEVSNKESKMAEKGGSYYQFKLNSRSVKPTFLHFQLRNLVWATSQHDVYLTSDSSIIHWNASAGTQSEVLNVAGHVAPVEAHPGSLLEGFRQTQVSTLAVKDGLLAVGGFQGELICKHLDRPGVSFCSRLTDDVNAIVNAVEIYNCPSGVLRLTAALNDCGVREFDVETFQETNHFRFPWPVNYTSQSPDGKLLVVVGDDTDGLLVDAQSGKVCPHCF
uniref:Uncharacterized protein n=1 Tax=Kalanchoe fedtschenkoi TaxID=63787 RepID=A0A7N0VGH9_KALFE